LPVSRGARHFVVRCTPVPWVPLRTERLRMLRPMHTRTPTRPAVTILIHPVTEINRAPPKAGNPIMFKDLIALLVVALAAGWASPSNAQTPGTSVGTLSCRMAPSIGLIFGSQQRMACRFQPSGPYPPEAYVGVMNTIGLDIGITAGGVMA
jgi:hypothetical protein